MQTLVREVSEKDPDHTVTAAAAAESVERREGTSPDIEVDKGHGDTVQATRFSSFQ